MAEIKGLIIDTPHIDRILSGMKIWEMRSTATKQRGLVALIRKGSGQVVGVVELVDSVGPLTKEQIFANQPNHMIANERLADPKVGKWNHAWVMQNAKLFDKPIPYQHPSGAVIWVKLDEAVSAAITRAAELLVPPHRSSMAIR